MVEKEINIDVVGNHSGNIIEFHTKGRYINRMNSEYIEYTDNENIKNFLKVTDNEIQLSKYTNPSTNMIFNKNRECKFKYNTGYGLVELEIKTKELKVEHNGYDLNIDIKYDVLFDEEVQPKELTIKTSAAIGN